MSARPDGGTQLYFGLYPAKVSDSTPDDLGRIEVELIWLGKNPSSASASEGEEEAGHEGDAGEPIKIRATLMSAWAAADQGLLAIPPVESQVIVAFEAGNPMRAYVVGACWNGVAQMPDRGSTSAGRSTQASEERRVLRTRAGHFLEFDDSSGSTRLTLASSSGHTLTFDDEGATIQIEHASGQTITLAADGSVQISANNTVSINAPSGLTVTAPTATFTGTVNCTTLTASISVVTPTYTPGVGNLL